MKGWDADAYYEWARRDPGSNVHAVELYEEGSDKPIAMMLLVWNHIYRGLVQDTIAIAKEHRSVRNLIRCQRAFQAYAVAYGRQVGAEHITGSTDRPEAMMRVLGPEHWEITEYVITRRL